MEIKIRSFNSTYFPSDKGANSIINIASAGYTFGNPSFKRKINSMDSATSSSEYYQLEYVTEGICHIEIGDRTYSVSEGEFFFINKGIPRTLYADNKKPVKKFFINIKGSLADGFIKGHELNQPILILKIDVLSHFLRLMGILGSADSYDAKTEGEISAELSRLLHKVYTAKQSTDAVKTSSDCSAEDILRYIDTNMGRKFSIEEMCEHFFISRAKLWRIFKSKYNTTPHVYLQLKRIEKAKYYLLHTNHPISTLHETIGLSDSKYFFQLFKKETGMTPLKFREKFFGMDNITPLVIKNPQEEFSLRKTGNALEDKR